MIDSKKLVPGAEVVCNNGWRYKIYTKEELCSYFTFPISCLVRFEIVGRNLNNFDGWQGWDSQGRSTIYDHNFDIKEIIKMPDVVKSDNNQKAEYQKFAICGLVQLSTTDDDNILKLMIDNWELRFQKNQLKSLKEVVNLFAQKEQK